MSHGSASRGTTMDPNTWDRTLLFGDGILWRYIVTELMILPQFLQLEVVGFDSLDCFFASIVLVEIHRLLRWGKEGARCEV